MNKKLLKRVRWNRVIMTLAVFAGLVFGVNKVVHAFTSEPQTPDKYEEVEVVIMPGDKAWAIQRELLPQSEDVREALHHAERVNEQNLGKLEVGQRVTFFKLADE